MSDHKLFIRATLGVAGAVLASVFIAFGGIGAIAGWFYKKKK